MPIYNQPYPQYTPQYNAYQPMVQSYNQPDTGIVWVQGESGAKAFPVQSGKSVVLFDAESEHFFIKTTDPSGMPQPLRIFSYKETNETEVKTPQIDTSNFITREEFETAINSLRNKQNNYQQKKEVNKNDKPPVL